MRATDSYGTVGVGRPKNTPLDSQLHAFEVAHQINVLLANAKRCYMVNVQQLGQLISLILQIASQRNHLGRDSSNPGTIDWMTKLCALHKQHQPRAGVSQQ